MKKALCNHINVGSGHDSTIRELVEIIKKVFDFERKINFNLDKLDGVYRKFLDSKRISNLGFKPEISLKDGLIKKYQEYLKD